MSIMKILAPVTGGRHDAVVLATAFAAARPFGAYVEVLFSRPDPRDSIPYSEMPLSPDVVQDLVDAAEKLGVARSAAARSTLAIAAAKADVGVVGRPARSEVVTASYAERTGHLVSCVEEAALLSDLIVFPPLGGNDHPDIHDAFVRILTRSGRPVLLSAETAPAEFGRKIAIGWDGRMAAAHALSGALPYLRRAASVEILSVLQAQRPPGAVEEVKTYLALHAVESIERVIAKAKPDIGELLLDTAVADGCDLLVVGGYGHSRLRETIFGGVTKSVVSHPKIPIFMVH